MDNDETGASRSSGRTQLFLFEPHRSENGQRPCGDQCRVEVCSEPVAVKKHLLCKKHYTRLQKHGDPHYVERERGAARGVACSVDGCNRTVAAKELCSTHYRRMRVHGDANHTPKSTRKYEPETLCSWEGCESRVRAGGFCHAHYHTVRYNSNLVGLLPENLRPVACAVEECQNPVYAKGLCRNHTPEKVKKKVRKAIETLEGFASLPELWPEGKEPQDLGWLHDTQHNQRETDPMDYRDDPG